MPTNRKIHVVEQSRPTLEGAGVRLRRAFGRADPRLDPFLLLDDFHSERPEDYLPGFPWHPHRGIETITYMLRGRVAHADSLGNRGVIGPGDVQWMTAGSGIVHQEMPDQDRGVLWGLQLWANLPAKHKLMPPRYRDIQSQQIPEASLDPGARVRVIAGEIDGVRGPVRDIVTDPTYLDVRMEPGSRAVVPVKRGRNAFVYVLDGEGRFGGGSGDRVGAEHLVVFEDGDEVAVGAETRPLRFLLVSGKPIGEPVAWRGPIVMNTEAQLDQAFAEYRQGTFIR